MARTSRILLTAFVIAAMAIGALVYLSVRDRDSTTTAQPDTGEAGQVVRENSHRLNTVPDSTVTFVEFLDFECEGCRAVYPEIEKARAEYGDRVNFVIRYFPLPGHANAVNAALAVEAAAQQGRLEDMYTILYRSQAEWGERQESQAELFRGLAEELGFNMGAYDAAIADPATAARVELDRGDAEGLGLQGTPSFFLNGEPLELTSAEDVTAAIDAALAAP